MRKDTRLLLVSNDAMRARRRPVAIFAYYIYQLAVSLVVAWPVSRALAAAFGGHPRGDAVLFDDGGWALARAALRLGARVARVLWLCSSLVTLFGAVVGLVPLSALLTSISHATPDTRAPRPRHLAPYVVATFSSARVFARARIGARARAARRRGVDVRRRAAMRLSLALCDRAPIKSRARVLRCAPRRGERRP